MKKIKLSFLANQSGLGVVAVMAIISIIGIGVGLFSFAYSAEAKKEGIVPADKYATAKGGRLEKSAGNNNAIYLELSKEGGEFGVKSGNTDDTGLTAAADDHFNTFTPDQPTTGQNKTSSDTKSPEQIKKVDQNELSEKELAEIIEKFHLGDDRLAEDVVKGVDKIVDTNAKLNADQKTKEEVLLNIVINIIEDASKKTSKVLDIVKKELDNKKILADAKTAKTKKELSRALSEKKYIEKKIAAKIAAYKDLVAQGYTSENDLSGWQKRLDYTNKQIAKFEGELEVLKQEESEKQYTVDLVEKQGQNDSLSQDTASGEDTAIGEETTTEEETAEPETTTTETDETTTEPDANLIHGVVPTKVTAHGTATDNTGVWEFNADFWNVGKLGGEQYAKATLTEVCTKPAEGMGVKQNTTVVFEGTFTGGPNGDMNLTCTMSSQIRSDSSETITQTVNGHCKVKDGKKIVFDAGTDVPIDNPEAFDGWVD